MKWAPEHRERMLKEIEQAMDGEKAVVAVISDGTNLEILSVVSDSITLALLAAGLIAVDKENKVA